MSNNRIVDALDKASVSIDILRATTLYYKSDKEVTSKEVLTMNEFVCELINEALNEVITALKGELIDVVED